MRDNPKKKRRVPGGDWRVHGYNKDGYKAELDSANNAKGFIFDEIVVDDWLHVEQIDTNIWWVRLGDQTFGVTVSRDRNRPSVVETT